MQQQTEMATFGSQSVPIITHDPYAKDYLGYAYTIAEEHSHDGSTKVGAVITHDGRFICDGVNRFPGHLRGDPQNHERPRKYKLIEHAERDAVYGAAKLGICLDGTEMYAPWAACSDCARAIVFSGIRRVVAHWQAIRQTPDRWMEEIALGIQIFEAGNVEYVLYDGIIGNSTENLFDGKIWYP